MRKGTGFFIGLFFLSFTVLEKNKIDYVCTPCGSDCDKTVYDKPCTCTHCNMKFVDKSTIVHKEIQPDKMCLLNEKEVIFLDVHTPAEFNGTGTQKFGAIKNAVNIPV